MCVFLALEYRKRHFPGLYCQKKKKSWKNVNFSAVWSSCFHSLESRFFALEYRKRHSPGLYCFKKKVEKMAIFEPKLWVNPFRKMSIFSIFWTSCFYSLERRFFVLEYRKRHFPGLYCLKKKLEKWPFLDQNHWLTPLEKMSVFRLSELLVFIA